MEKDVKRKKGTANKWRLTSASGVSAAWWGWLWSRLWWGVGYRSSFWWSECLTVLISFVVWMVLCWTWRFMCGSFHCRLYGLRLLLYGVLCRCCMECFYWWNIESCSFHETWLVKSEGEMSIEGEVGVCVVVVVFRGDNGGWGVTYAWEKNGKYEVLGCEDIEWWRSMLVRSVL